MDTINFEYVIEVSKTKNVTRAAENLFISQPALSQAIKRIEKNYNIKLFDKEYNLTSDGEIFLKYAIKIKKNLNALDSELNKKELNIGISQFYGKYLLNQILSTISKIDENIKVHIREDNSSNLEDLIEKGELDMGFFPEPLSGNLNSKTLFKENLILAMPEDLYSEDFYKKEQRILAMKKGFKLRYLSDKIYDELKIKYSEVFEATNLDTINSLILNKNAIALLPSIIERLDKVKYTDINYSRNFLLVYRNTSKINVDKFLEIYKNFHKK